MPTGELLSIRSSQAGRTRVQHQEEDEALLQAGVGGGVQPGCEDSDREGDLSSLVSEEHGDTGQVLPCLHAACRQQY